MKILKHRKLSAIGLLALGAGLIALTFQNCGPQNLFRPQAAGTRTYDSPFKEKKVVLRDQTLNQVLNPSVAAKTDAVLTRRPLLNVVVNNACAEKSCGQPGEHPESLACRLLQDRELPELRGQIQFYTEPAPDVPDQAALTAWADRDPVDHACIIGVSESFLYSHQGFNDPYYAQQATTLNPIEFEAGLTSLKSTGLSRVKVAVIDTGIANLPELPTVIYRADLRSAANQSSTTCGAFTNDAPNNGHGTFVAGIIAAAQNNSMGIAGLAPNADLLAFAVGDCLGSNISTAEIGNALYAGLAQGADIYNISLGGEVPDDPSLRQAVIAVLGSNALIVIAAGNSSQDIGLHPFYPAAYSRNYQGIITVAATDQFRQRATFSNYGPDYVNLAAPGVGVVSINASSFGSGYGPNDGTSFAAPLVAGTAALLKGSLVARSLDSSAARLQQLLTGDGAATENGLKTSVRNGAFLDVLKAADASRTSVAVTQLQILSSTVDLSGTSPVVQVTFAWNVPSLPVGARLGIFDLSSGCNFSSPCLIQNFDVTTTSGQITAKIPRNQLVALMSNLRDPSAALPIGLAIYYPIAGKAVYGTTAQANLDLRSLDASATLAKSDILGLVSNVRMDMQYLYIRGWSCKQANNAALSVRLQLADGTSVNTKFGYDYPYMVPHSGPIDGTGNYGLASEDVNVWPHSVANYVNSISILGADAANQKSAFEADPNLVAKCMTLTASHGYELILPLSRLASAGLVGQSFQVIATIGAQAVALPDALNRTTFTFPDTNFQTSSEHNFAVARTPTAYTFSGYVCSTSPSPVEVEASFTPFNYTLAMYDSIPDHSAPGYAIVVNSPLVSDMQILTVTWNPATKTFVEKLTPIDPTSTDDFTVFYLSIPVGQRPNFFLATDPFSVSELDRPGFVDGVASYQPRDFRTAQPLKFDAMLARTSGGNGLKLDDAGMQVDRATISNISTFLGSAGEYWDYNDVGPGFSPSLVEYKYDYTKTVGNFLANNYGVLNVLRENKKFETPLAAGSTILAHGQLGYNGACNGGVTFMHKIDALKVDNYVKYELMTENSYRGYRLASNPYVPLNLKPRSVAETMYRLPLTLRFFQDGKLLLHLESDFANTFYEVRYRFQSAGYQ